MRVLHLANGYFGSRLYAELFGRLEAKQVENAVFVPVREGETYRREGNICAYPAFSQLDRFLFYSKQRKILEGIGKEYPQFPFDLIHAHTVFSGGYAAYQLHLQHGCPYVVAVRNTDVNVFFKYMLHLRKVGVDIMRHAAKVVFLSPVYRDKVLQTIVPLQYRAELEEKSIVLPNGIADLFLQNKAQPRQLPGDVLRLIYVGQIDRNKNLEQTIRAVKLLRQEGRDVTLTAVGDVKDACYTKLMAEAGFVTHHKRCPQEQVLEYMRQADIFVMPSHAETFGLVYAEAMSQGLPVIYTRGQGFDGQFPEGEVGFSVSDHSAAELAEKIRQVCAGYDRMSENSIRAADRFNWSAITDTYYEIYQNACRIGEK